MNKETKLVIGLLVIVSSISLYYFMNKKKNTNEKEKSAEDYAVFIVKSGNHTNFSTLITFENDFLKAWTEAIQNAQDTFTYNGNKFLVKGGKSTK